MQTVYRTAGGICAKEIKVDIEDGVVRDVQFSSGCPGNHQGIAALVIGMDAEVVAGKLRGITCGHRASSCPDQLACAITEALQA